MPEQGQNVHNFSKIRSIFWPIHASELKKLLPMLLLFFLISFDYNILRTIKDSLVIKAQGSGVAIIPAIKIWLMFPGTILMTYIFTKLSRTLNWATVIYLMLGIFIAYFTLFILFIYPNHEVLHPHAFANYLQSILPCGFKGTIAMIRNWTFSTFYVMSELWSPIILTMLFWGYTNEVIKFHESKRFYGLFGIGANISGIFAGQISASFCCIPFNPHLPFGHDAWEQVLFILISLVIVIGVVIILLFRWINQQIFHTHKFKTLKEKEKNGKLTITDNFQYLKRSKYLINIAIMVIAYNIAVNLAELIWKDQVDRFFPNAIDFNYYSNQISTMIGVFATLFALFLTNNTIRKYGWTYTAMVTPAIMLVTSTMFYFFFFGKDLFPFLTGLVLFGQTISPLAIIVFLGSMQNILTRASKYSVYDATKEMAFIPIDAECRLKGKSIIDGICNRLGKAGGSLILYVLTLLSTLLSSIFAEVTFLEDKTSIEKIAPFVAIITFVVIVWWMIAVKQIGKEFNKMTAPKPMPIPDIPSSEPAISSSPEAAETSESVLSETLVKT